MQTKSILSIVLCFFITSASLFITSCAGNEKIAPVEFRNFTAEIDSISKNGISVIELRSLKKEHSRFFALWLQEILDFEKYGPTTDSMQSVILSDFISKNKQVLNAIQSHYQRFPNLHKDISKAIGKLQFVMGTVKKPVIYSYFSQFSNYNTFVDTFGGQTIFAYSSEMFMNDTFPLYKMLEVPEFFTRYNKTNQIPAMLVWNYLKSSGEGDMKSKNMLSEAVVNGKIWYTMTLVFPDSNPWDLFGYSEKEWKQMNTEEGQIWKHYLDNSMLFQSDFNKYKRYFNYGTHTFGPGIPADCPPLIGNFTGYRIVDAYMKKNKAEVKALWRENDAEKILQLSGYNPIK